MSCYKFLTSISNPGSTSNLHPTGAHMSCMYDVVHMTYIQVHLLCTYYNIIIYITCVHVLG